MVKEKLEEDLKNALKARDALKISVLRLLLSDIHNKQIDKRDELTDEEVLKVLQSSVKKHEDSIAQFKTGGRADLVDIESGELNVIKTYLPEAMPDEEVAKLVDDAISKMGASSEKDFGKVIKEVMKQVSGQASGALVSRLVKEKLNSKH